MHHLKTLAVFLTVALFVAACSQTAAPPNTTVATNTVGPKASPTEPGKLVVPETSASDVTELYATNCMICHKDNGTGGKVTIQGKTINADDLTSDRLKKATDDRLIAYITDGVPDEGMPAFKDKLSAEEIKQLVKHIRTLQGGDGNSLQIPSSKPKI